MKFWFHRGAWASKKARQVAEQINPAEVKSIAVIRHAALGDMVLTRAFLVEVRRFFPAASITLSLSSNYTFGAPEDLVDRTHVMYGSDQKKLPLKEQIKRARELGYHDLVFDLAATARSFWLCKLTSARLKVGFPYHTLQRVFYDITVPRSDLVFEAENMLDMLNLFGHANQYPLDYGVTVQPEQRGKPYIIYFPGASMKDKCWPQESFIELIRSMSADYLEYEHVVLKGVSDWESVDALMASLSDCKNVTELDRVGFSAMASLIKGASLMVCNDTGVRHMAIVCDTPTVGIFFSTPVFRYWPRYGGHEAAFKADGSMPDVEQVQDLAHKLLENKS